MEASTNPAPQPRKDLRSLALRLAGGVALATAVYHGISGDRILGAIPMSEANLSFVSGTYQLGTMGWVAGGALLIGAARLTDQKARNLIVVVVSVLFAIPAVGTLALTGGSLSIGGVALTTVVALALFGRRQDKTPQVDKTSTTRLRPERPLLGTGCRP